MNSAFFVVVSLCLFLIGLVGVLMRRNVLMLFLSIELMLNASNLLFVLFANVHGSSYGLAIVFFVLVVAAAEAAVGFALIINAYRSHPSVDVDQYNLLKG